MAKMKPAINYTNRAAKRAVNTAANAAMKNLSGQIIKSILGLNSRGL